MESSMICVEELSYGFPQKDLYDKISFTLETGQHCALIGSNGTGKSTLIDMLMYPDKYLYDGKIVKAEECRIGYVNQFAARDKVQDRTVFEFLSERFVEIQDKIADICQQMAEAEDMDAIFEEYQKYLDISESMDGDNYESNIRKQLYVGGMRELEETKLSQLSGGEYKLLQVMREMLLQPNLLIMDEPDVFLDFGNLNRLCQLINNYKGTLLVVTHNRYLLNHCFNKILHIEDTDVQEYDGNYGQYNSSLLREKYNAKVQFKEEEEEIARNQKLVDRLRVQATAMDNASLGRALKAKQTHLDRLRARKIKDPFLAIREPDIVFPQVEQQDEEKVVLSLEDYRVEFEECLLEHVDFQLKAGEKVAVVGSNGTGKTTLMRDLLRNEHPGISIDKETPYACLSQLQGEMLDEDKTVFEILDELGFETMAAAGEYLEKYCLSPTLLKQKVGQLSGGEQNMLQLAVIASGDAQLLILDEPTSHLDIYAQKSLEKALADYEGAVLMVSHDFYLVVNCCDYILLVEDKSIRRVRTRTFRKMVYDKYFDQKYLENDQKKQELEGRIEQGLKNNELSMVEKLCDQLDALTEAMAQ